MFFLYPLLFSLFPVPISNAFSTYSVLDSGPAPDATSPQVLGRVSELHIASKPIAPDGYNRTAVVINDKFPGPLIRALKHDEVVVKVSNELTDPGTSLETSVHWHGIFQHSSNWADGVAGVTQCPIGPNKAFEYKFNLNQTGTYWYHSHYSTQYCDGLRGPLVIYDPEDPLAHLYDVDDENTVITLAEWYHESSASLGALFAGVQANSTLINGRGRYPGGPSTPLSVINVKQGLRYRFRLVSMSCAPLYNFTIDGHRMTIIEADGNEVLPVQVDSIPILAGQRYSVIVTADQPVGNYWMRSLPNVPANSTFDGGQSMAILQYEGAPEQDPTSEPGPYELSFDEGALHPLVSPGAPGIPEIGKADVNIQMFTGINSTGYFTMNNAPYLDAGVPVLLQILSGARHPSQLLPQGSVYELPSNKVIEINFPNATAAPKYPHPMHLHGHAFDVVRVSGSNATNFVDPIRRDVVSMGSDPNDNVTIRFVTDNAGPWFLHCHIDWHLHHGFAVVMAEAPDEAVQQEAQNIPADWFELCAAP